MGTNTVQELKDTTNILQAVFDSAPNGIAIMHPAYNTEGRVEDFTIELFNAYTRNWIGDIEYKGKRYGDLFPMVKPTGILERFIQVFETGITAKFEQWYTGEGMKHWFRFTAVKQRDLLVITTEDITDRKQAEEMVRDSEERLSNIINQVNAGIVQATIDGQLISANERYAQLTGYTVEELLALTIKDITHPDDWPRNEELVGKALNEGKNFFIEKRYLRKDGSVIWVNNSVSIVTDSKGNKFITAVSVDITEQITSRQKLEESESHFRLMADTISEIIWVTDAKGRAEFFNKRWEEFSGVAFEPSMVAEIAARFVHPDDAPVVMKAFAESIKTGQPMEVEQRNLSGSGQWRWVLNRAMPYRNPQTGEVEKWFGISTDIHEQKMAQQALTESEIRFRALVNATSDVIYRLSADWKIMYPLDGKGFLLDAHAPVEGWMEINVHPSEFDRVKKAIAAAIANKTVFELEHQVVTVDGSAGWTFSRAVPILDSEGTILEWFGTASDITARKLIEQSLKESEARFRTMVEQAQVPIGMTRGREMIFEAINAPMLELIGMTGKNVLQKNLTEVLPELESQAIMKILRQVWDSRQPFQGHSIPATWQVDGKPVKKYYDISYTPVATEGKMQFIIHLAIDVTEQVMARQKIEEVVARRTRELSAANETLSLVNKELQRSNAQLEEFAHAASHDLKEPVRKIHYFTQHLKEHLGTDLKEGELRAFNRIENATERMRNLIDDLLLYSHVSQRPHEKESIDLNMKVQAVLEDLELVFVQG